MSSEPVIDLYDLFITSQSPHSTVPKGSGQWSAGSVVREIEVSSLNFPNSFPLPCAVC